MNLTKRKINFPFVYAAALLCVLCLLTGDAFGQKTANSYAHMKAEHAAAVKNYVGVRTNFRPAQVADCKNKFGLASLRRNNGEAAHPFYAVADFNGDNAEDFAVVLYDSKSTANARFTVLIFNGAKRSGYKMSYQSAYMDLSQGGIWTDGFGTQDGKTTLTAGVFETDDAIRVEWSDGKYVAQAAETDN